MSSGKADIRAVIGSSGSGKSLWIKTRALPEIKRPVLVWDSMREYGNGLSKLSAVVAAIKGGAIDVVYVPNKARDLERQFETWCGIALATRNCALIVEELSEVTKAGYSPPRWREVVTTGRHYGLTVIATTQAPALCDKTFFSNATLVRVGRLNAASHKKYMADALDIDVAELRALRPLEWIQKDMSTGALTRETLTPPGARPRARRKTSS